VEIGAGLGSLTAALARAGAAEVLAIEFDRALLPALEEAVVSTPAVRVVAADATRVDWTATLGAGLFSALVVVVLGVVMAGERAVGSAPPTIAQSVAAALAGLGGTVAASIAAAGLASSRSRAARVAVPTSVGVLVALGAGWLLA